MSSLELALVGDFWRRGRWGFLLALVGMTTLPILVYGALWNESGRQTPSPEVNLALHVPFALTFGFAAMAAMFHAQGRLARFFPRPISTARLVICQQTLGLLVVALLYLAGTAVLNLVTGAGWPLWGPALFLATAAVCAQAAIWWTEGSVALQLVACLATSIPLVLWFLQRYGAFTVAGAQEMWLVPTGGEIAVLATVAAGGYGVAVWGVGRQRQGASSSLDALLTAAGEWLTSASTSGARFSSAASAMAWYEWRQKHSAIPAVVMAAIVLLALGLRVFGRENSNDMLEGPLLGVPFAVLTFLFPLLFGFLLGNGGTSQRPHSMRPLVATRPQSCQALAGSLLSTGATSLVYAWVVWVLGLAAGIGLCFKLDGAAELASVLNSTLTGYWHFPLFVLLALPAGWGLLGVVLALTSTGRMPLMMAISFGVLIPAMFLMGVAKSLTPEFRARFDEVGVGVIGLIAIGALAFCITLTRSKRLVTERTTWLVVAGWLILGGAAVVLCLTFGLTYIGWLIHVAGFCALIMLPFVSVPLAVHWNRHR